MSRPTADESFMAMAFLVAKRSTCLRRKVGAVLVSPVGHVLATGRNGTPRGLKHASEVGCLREKLGIKSGERAELCRGLHAEQNLLIQLAREGGCSVGSTIYCTNQPCSTCAKMLIQAGIIKVVYGWAYHDELAVALFAEAGVVLEMYQGMWNP